MCISREMPRYKCHKQVHALQIATIDHKDSGATITPLDAGFGPFDVDATFIGKHSPQPGGYYVVYEDGYKSYSPAEAFEQGYKLIEPIGAEV